MLTLQATLGLILLIASLFAPTFRSTISPSRVSPESGHAFTTKIGKSVLYYVQSDYAEGTSSLVVLENGRPLDPAHQSHADVRSKGKGAYSHWGETLYFSTSDNSDPTSNGRTYTYVAPSALRPGVLWLAAAASLLLFWLSRDELLRLRVTSSILLRSPERRRRAFSAITAAAVAFDLLLILLATMFGWNMPASILVLAYLATAVPGFAIVTELVRWRSPGFDRRGRIALAFGTALSSVCVLLYWLGWALGPKPVFFTPDSWGYLRPALTWYGGQDLQLTHARSFAYPLFLAWVTWLFGLNAISSVQIFLAGMTALLSAAPAGLLVLWSGARNTFVAALVAILIPLGVVALLAYQPLTSHASAIMPETLSSFLVTASCFALACAFVLQDKAKQQAVAMVVAALCSATTPYVRPSATAFAIAVWIALAGILIWRCKIGRIAKYVSACAILTFVLGTMAWYQSHLQQRYDPGAVLFGPMTLLCFHADIVAPVVPSSSSDAELIKNVRQILQDTLRDGPNGYPVLGFNGDTCFYRSRLSQILNAHFNGDYNSMARFARDYFIWGVVTNPISYALKVIKQMALAISKLFPNARERNINSHGPYEWARKEAEMKRVGTIAMPSGLEPSPLALAVPQFYRVGQLILRIFNVLGPWLIIATMLVASLDLFRRPAAASSSERSAKLLKWGALAAAVTLYLSCLIIVAMAHSFDVVRYIEVAAPMAMVVYLLCMALLSEYVVDHFRNRHPSNGRPAMIS